jgi:Tfp pilus assembly protein PilF
MKTLFRSLVALTLLSLCQLSLADLDQDIQRLQSRWAEVNYQLEGEPQIAAFEDLIANAEAVTKAYPNKAEGWIWSGIIKSTYAGAKGGLNALKFAKASKKDLEKALSINSDALQGSAYTSLGTLYYNVPGWPIGFGDDDKAEELLRKALTINPDGIDSNYFYGDFLIGKKRYKEARDYLIKASKAAPRPNRAVADQGRQQEISLALKKVSEKLR